MKKINIAIFISLLIGVLTGCKKNLLDVPNQNDPDFAKVLSNGNDVQALAAGLFITIYNGEHSYSGAEMMLATASDNVSCSWGNAGMRDMSWEPRDHAWDNTAAYGNAAWTKYTFDKMYSAIGTASSIMQALAGGVKVTNDAQVKAFAKFAQGVAYGNLALIYDRAFIVDETQTVDSGALGSAVDYKQIAAAAIGYLNDAIGFCSNSFTIPSAWLGTAADLSNNDLKALCNTMAARILAYLPRNKTDLAAVNWAQVKTYADAGITSDFSVIGDAYVNWYDEAGDYLTFNGWGMTDMYVVHMMDPTEPAHWDDSPTFPYPPQSTSPLDQRLNSDFEYVASNWLDPSRGYYHFSAYRNKRYDALYVNDDGTKPEVMKAENDMLRAEARAYTSDLAGAATIINAGTRTTRGHMTNVAADLTAIVDAIHHERNVEMYTTGIGLQFFEMRKLNLLQKGTPLHLPLPAGTLQTLNAPLPFYTFGHVANADGVNTSNAGWR